MVRRAIVIGLPETCSRVERQLDLVPQRPESVGWIVPDLAERAKAPVLGTCDDLEALVTRHRPDVVLVSLPSEYGPLIQALRTRLRRLRVPDRFMPTLEDQLAGVGPRARLDVNVAELLDRPPRAIDDAAVRDTVEGRTVLITGAGGSIGSELARVVSRYGAAHLVLVERSENALFEIDRQIGRHDPALVRTPVLHDVVHAAETKRLLRRLRPDVVFHAAAHKHVPMMEDHPAAAVDNNLFGTRSVADAADAAAVERFVFISTDKAVRPSSIMGATKRFAERYIEDIDGRSATRFSVVRFGNVLGSSGSVLDIWARELADGGPLTVTDERMTRYFMTIPEAAALVVQSAALPADKGTPVYVLDMGEPLSVPDLAWRFIELNGYDPDTVGVVFTGRRPGEKLHEQLACDPKGLQTTAHPDIRVLHETPPGRGVIERMLTELSPRERGCHAAAVADAVRRQVVEPRQAAA